MSKLTKQLSELHDETRDLSRKQGEITKEKINSKYGKLKLKKDLEESFKKLGTKNCFSMKAMDVLDRVNDEIVATVNPYPLISNCFENKIEICERQLMLGFSSTGGGKSTFVANVAYNVLSFTDKKVVILSNEERDVDVMGRVACLFAGYNFNDRRKFSKDQNDVFLKYCEMYKDRLVIIDDEFSNVKGCTSTPEGLEESIEYLVRTNILEDTAVLVLDYFQNINFASQASGNHYEALFRASSYLSQKKNFLPCGILVMAQIKPAAGSGKARMNRLMDFKSRMIQAKKIADESTLIFEIVPNRKELTTMIFVHKNRFGDYYGPEKIKWDKGLFRKLTEEEELKYEV